jgi:glycerol uptake facilitator-like aquaporin
MLPLIGSLALIFAMKHAHFVAAMQVMVYGGAVVVMFLFVIMGATDIRVTAGFAPIPIGLVLTLIHLISIPVTNTSVNPARSTGPAIFVGGWAIEQLWLFWLAPIVGGVLGGLIYRSLASEPLADAVARLDSGLAYDPPPQ